MKNTVLLNKAASSRIVKNTNRISSVPASDITRGARLHGIRSSIVLLESEILDGYGEIDPALGQNFAGVILAVLACHLEMNPGGTHEDQITICAIRRDDAATVELNLHITRERRHGGEQILLRKGDEREVEAGGHRFASHAERHALAGHL